MARPSESVKVVLDLHWLLAAMLIIGVIVTLALVRTRWDCSLGFAQACAAIEESYNAGQ